MGLRPCHQIGTNTILFNYANRAALLADGWSFYATNDGAPRNTEILTGAGMIDYNQTLHPGVLNIPCDQGDLYGTAYNNTRNTLFRSLPADWQSVRLALTFAPVAANYQQAHLGLYQDDDNYMQMGVAYNNLGYHLRSRAFHPGPRNRWQSDHACRSPDHQHQFLFPARPQPGGFHSHQFLLFRWRYVDGSGRHKSDASPIRD